ncbi:unnamed protein product [Rotaria sp. Silwood2]|nr:unnamed protein product [Rotaria sp. Silwood2]CAF4162501.1 unnamed protein product [Rotaria sp. Silwood2]
MPTSSLFHAFVSFQSTLSIITWSESLPLRIIWTITTLTVGQCFETGWDGSIPLTDTDSSPVGTKHYAITECVLLRIGADYIKRFYGSSQLDNIASVTGVCTKAVNDLAAISAEAKRLRISSDFGSAIYTISVFNVITDAVEVFSERSHFDNESFTQASQLVQVQIRNAIEELKIENLFNARISFGMAMHTVQHFYTHSNWIELGQSQPKFIHW